MIPSTQKEYPSLGRRLFLYIGGLFCLYPILRFITHKTPRVPVVIEVHEPLNSAGFLLKDRFIIFSRMGKTWAVSRTCTHLGCTLNYKEKEDWLECPCHQSRFSTSGSVLQGPAKKPLIRYPAEKNPEHPFITVIT